jgi:hypothetical protein
MEQGQRSVVLGATEEGKPERDLHLEGHQGWKGDTRIFIPTGSPHTLVPATLLLDGSAVEPAI